MSVKLILTLLGNDRPGLVELLAQTLSQHQANWLESRFSRLAGKFAGVLSVEAPAEQAEPLTHALQQLTELKIRVESAQAEPEQYPHQFQLKLTAHDRRGIVHQLSQLLHRLGINVEQLTTEVSSAPMSGETLFIAEAQLQAKDAAQITALRQELEALSDELMVEIDCDSSH